MAAVTARAIVWTTTAGAKTTGSFAPASGELLVAVVGVAGTDTAPTMSDSLGGGWTLVDTFRSHGSGVTGGLRMYCRNSAVSGAAMTVTMTPSGDTGGGLAVLSVTNPGAFGASAVAGNGGQADQAAGTPAPVLDSTPSVVNPVIVAVMTQTNGSANSAVRTSFTEDYDQGFGSPASGIEVQHRNSGETSATLTLGAATPSGFASIGVEIPVTQSVSSGVASEADSGPSGTVSQPTVVSGGVSQEADAVPSGQVSQLYVGSVAAEQDAAPPGSVSEVYSGGVSPAEGDSAPGGLVQQVYTSSAASEADSVPSAQVLQVYAASIANETDSTVAGTVDQGGAGTTVNGGIASSSETAPGGTAGQIYLAPTVSEADAALAGAVLQTVYGGVAAESDSAPGGQPGQAILVAAGVATEADSTPAGSVPAVEWSYGPYVGWAYGGVEVFAYSGGTANTYLAGTVFTYYGGE